MDEADMPDDLYCEEQIFDLVFHPINNDILAVAQIDGAVNIYRYMINEPAQHLISNKCHKGSCRGLLFGESGTHLYTISSDRSIQILDSTGQTTQHIQDAHDDSINKITSLSQDGHFATGDDSGVVKIWDSRVSANQEVMKFTMHEDFVSGMTYHEETRTLLSVGGDATLCAYDLRHSKNSSRSDDQEAELHCVTCLKNGRKVVCGSQDGVILVFSWGRWGDCSDRYPGHPQTVDCMLKIDESTVITGSTDGLIRVVAMQPNKILGIIGDHEEFPVEGLSASSDGRILGSFAHDEIVRFWDISMFAEDDEDEGDEDCAQDICAVDPTAVMTAEDECGDDSGDDADEEESVSSEKMHHSDDDNDHSNDKDEDDDDDDSSDDENQCVRGRKPLKTAAEKFYADL